MIRDLLQKERVIAKLKAALEITAKAADALDRKHKGALKLKRKYGIDSQALKDLLPVIDRALRSARKESSKTAFMPRDSESSMLQLALEDFYRELNCLAPPRQRLAGQPRDPLSDQLLANDPLEQPASAPRLVEFGGTDPGWVFGFLAAQRLQEKRGTIEFPQDRAPVVKMMNPARLVIVGDWGTGIPRARDVADLMEVYALEGVKKGCDTHVISLGDVYYAGFEEEYRDRFLSCWPVKKKDAAKIKSWALNGNHDMYSGGQGFFNVLLADPRFKAQNGSSFFLIENDYWRIAGLDTAYDPPDVRGNKGNLYGNQGRWLKEQFSRKPKKRTMLLTHHQPFSAWEGESPKLVKALMPVFDLGKIDVWFWGHEHRCAVYEENEYVKHSSLLGHGGVPVSLGREGNQKKAKFSYEDRGPHVSGFRQLGFAVADLDKNTCSVTYYNERNNYNNSAYAHREKF
jgi:predicted phosphodiesterase